ncbi:CheR family methyltransferase [Desulfatirhabdium butyrativorans]|uniref:CheR family methyltransferase n=1 Tax=Desulfatirhabdium butyrativorans TaxID=340467 RepID=UPI00040C571A|nr:CheR family methyltransferase [Desulfatirhabdium butyrativorans]
MAFTFFFRDLPVIEKAVEHAVEFGSGRMRFKVWDAGSALGQETYTIAIVLAEKMGKFAFKNLRLHATDYDSANHFGEVVKEAVYHVDELKRMPEGILDKYFEPASKPDHYRVIQNLRDRVQFEYHDLLSYQPIGTDFCLIVCKNVLLHFQHAERVEVIKMFHKALLPGGYFTTEHTQKLPEEVSHLFDQVTPNNPLYRKR